MNSFLIGRWGPKPPALSGRGTCGPPENGDEADPPPGMTSEAERTGPQVAYPHGPHGSVRMYSSGRGARIPGRIPFHRSEPLSQDTGRLRPRPGLRRLHPGRKGICGGPAVVRRRCSSEGVLLLWDCDVSVDIGLRCLVAREAVGCPGAGYSSTSRIRAILIGRKRLPGFFLPFPADDWGAEGQDMIACTG